MKNNAGKHISKFPGFCLSLVICLAMANLASSNAWAENLAQPAPAVAAQVAATIPDTAASSSVASPVNGYKPALPTGQKSSTTTQLANLVGGLALILVLIYGLSWFVKRFSQGGFAQNSSIKMLSSMPLGTRERLMLVEVGGKQILLGVTATQINSLHIFDEPVVASSEKNTSQAPSDFSQKLMAILQQKNIGKTDSSAHKNIK